ncbi:DNA-binding response regulator [Pacificitalea manganoxidans]|uniref:DNA-binding response regulator n=1 Tax=Pacificitalea manganoxidans TaxID=1411902 RepID=A0A291LWW9_9RHOB|nr:response regulator transcription factor [Pacificitalea manganoxidans]ATI41137.1 DNA-binding response regulator [Pacificitalea manganoxidans]MAQ44778.1 DNA-binding response regulator [Actibacterium sp.]MDR6308510.1 two-component system response regulator TctD [Pacificitalea manganoxidans]OWU69324.1 chemotaxis protein CheY [Roseovarius sp. 22II1-1F6A]|tara:strand:- start:33 stop:704 length:672 start_codon:yes stop_codon:yes gene_type:complete
MRILMVEDARDLAEGVIAHLARSGVVCDLAPTINDARDCRAVQRYDAIILDINLPDGSGLTLLREMRAQADRTPILMLTALASIDDRVEALDQGADDYLRKPFDQRELEARLRALVRRETDRREEQVTLGALTYLPKDRSATLNDRQLDLTRREAALLDALIRHQGQYLSKTRLYDSLYGFEDADVGVNAIELYIARLRKKFAGSDVGIATQRGVGYRIGLND